jgi:WD40 repeat protein
MAAVTIFCNSFTSCYSNPLLCAATHEHLLATGDEEGCVKLWDLRQSKELFSWEENEDFISELLLCPENNAVLASRFSALLYFIQ